MDLQEDRYTERTHFVFIDSRRRNRRAYPSSAAFDITLDSAIRNVVGMELVDTYVAKTELNVDKHNNAISMRVLPATKWTVVEIETGDYGSKTFTAALQTALRKASSASASIGFVSVSVDRGRLVLNTGAPIEINVASTSARMVLGFGALVADAVQGEAEEIVRSETNTSQQNTVCMDLVDVTLLATATISGAQLPALDFVNPLYGVLSIQVLGLGVQDWRITDRMDLNVVHASGTFTDQMAYTSDMTPGNYSLVLGGMFLPGQRVELDRVLIEVSRVGFSLTCPGVMDLAGTRYVTLRCPELEPHLYRMSPSSNLHFGLGKVVLLNNGYNSVINPGTGYPTSRFPAIDSLKRMSFRVERDDGSLYDTKGVDWLATLAFHIRVPSAMQAHEFGLDSQLPRNRSMMPHDFQRFAVHHH